MASGIAASLGLQTVDSPSNVNSDLQDNTSSASGPLSDLEHFDTSNDDNFDGKASSSSSSTGVAAVRGVKRGRSAENTPPTPTSGAAPPKKVSKLVLEWTEDEEGDKA